LRPSAGRLHGAAESSTGKDGPGGRDLGADGLGQGQHPGGRIALADDGDHLGSFHAKDLNARRTTDNAKPTIDDQESECQLARLSVVGFSF
jgi:hypothetical protein